MDYKGNILGRLQHSHSIHLPMSCGATSYSVPFGETEYELREEIRYFLQAFRYPVLEEKEKDGKEAVHLTVAQRLLLFLYQPFDNLIHPNQGNQTHQYLIHHPRLRFRFLLHLSHSPIQRMDKICGYHAWFR